MGEVHVTCSREEERCSTTVFYLNLVKHLNQVSQIMPQAVSIFELQFECTAGLRALGFRQHFPISMYI